jgi:hypothetical protein
MFRRTIPRAKNGCLVASPWQLETPTDGTVTIQLHGAQWRLLTWPSFAPFMESECSSPCSQELGTVSYSEWLQRILDHISLRSILIRFSKQATNGRKTAVMNVVGFVSVSPGSSTVQLHDSVGSRRACACSEAGFSSKKMAIVIVDCITEE